MPNIGSLRKREDVAAGRQGSGFADVWVYDLEDGEEGYGGDSEDECYDGTSDETHDEDEEEDDDVAPFENPVTELDRGYQNWIRDWKTSENRKMFFTLLGADSPTSPPDEMLSSSSTPFDEYRPAYDR
ncbi:hypothetical protein D6D28_10603 [Aureobasidium pullulans]|uniref:Uncharacterized protein n=1 Tax=Aureobasidium pullulans TaxID=5580 RepID=A0A4S8RZ11_AURPU|nr:hypothetical protein D6D28_10603 [Aureobasidium pullulans]